MKKNTIIGAMAACVLTVAVATPVAVMRIHSDLTTTEQAQAPQQRPPVGVAAPLKVTNAPLPTSDAASLSDGETVVNPVQAQQVENADIKDAKGNYRTSFNCLAATTPSEILVCHDRELAKADVRLGEAYADAHDQPGADRVVLRMHARDSLKYRDYYCRESKQCLTDWYATQRQYYADVVASATRKQ